ncbi:MAG TPA: proprotein convertase P-domain-containing protein, partial [Thermoanaerobaculia bacterium]|nr:proprotein convertase P-domain-containing protein [Thermoanaerobaculia bacterium]
VGAVYPQAYPSRTWLDDSGGIQCTDAPIAPDEIICFSDSSTALSMLAPGDFWLVANKGGGVGIFAGTSSASPAVAGAVMLLKQMRPDLSAAGINGILRATGAPILDPRNGVTTPRLDTLAAVTLDPTTFFPYVGATPTIPDGTGSASASIMISGFSGSIAGIQVWVQLDHPDPEQLLVTLTGPDGTQVVLHDHTGVSEQPINAIYGKTDVPKESLGAFQGHQANGVWTLTVEDTVADGSIGQIRNFAVLLQAGQPTAAIPANVNGRVLPVLSHAQASKFFLSDFHIFNPAAVEREFSLYFVPGGQTGNTAALSKVMIGPGQVFTVQDAVANQFGFANATGPLVATTTDTNFLISGRLYTNTVNGSFGHTVPGFLTSGGLSFGGGTATANGLIKSDEFHTNVGFTEVSGSPVQVQVDVLDGSGTMLGSTSIVTGPYTTPIMGDVITTLGLAPLANFRANFTVTSASGRIVPFATYVDDTSGDSIFQQALNPAASAEDLILIQAAHLTGANSDFFKTDVFYTNVDANPANITVTLIPNKLTGPAPSPQVYDLAPGQTLAQTDVLASAFGLSDPSFAGMRIHPDGAARLVVTNNTYVAKFGGTAGYSVQAVPVSAAVGLGKTVRSIGLYQTQAAAGFRCNFGFLEVGGAAGVIQVTAKSGADGSVIATKFYNVPANTLVQTTSRDLVGDGATDNFYLEFTVVSGGSLVLDFATVNDNTSGDAIVIAGE